MYKDIDIDIDVNDLINKLDEFNIESLNKLKEAIDNIIDNDLSGSSDYISYSECEVDIDVDHDDIIDELDIYSDNKLKKIYERLRELLNDITDDEKIYPTNLYDIQKEELCVEIYNKFNLQQIEDMIRLYENRLK